MSVTFLPTGRLLNDVFIREGCHDLMCNSFAVPERFSIETPAVATQHAILQLRQFARIYAATLPGTARSVMCCLILTGNFPFARC
jgi:hypothetical protein